MDVLVVWGASYDGELGEEDKITTPTLKIFDAFSTSKIKHITGGLNHTLFLTNLGKLYSCGSNAEGQLGRSGSNIVPALVSGLNEEFISEVAAGDSHSVVLTRKGKVYAWGSNSYGQIGNGDDGNRADVQNPVEIDVSANDIVQITCGSNHTMALSNVGSIFSWGHNVKGQLGLGHTFQMVSVPSYVSSLSFVPVKCILSGKFHSMAVTERGNLFTWGSNKRRELVRDTNIGSFDPEPSPITNALKNNVAYAIAGGHFTAIIDYKGNIFLYGILDNQSNYTKISLEGTIIDIACGSQHVIAYSRKKDTIYAFGEGEVGQLGIYTEKVDSFTPVNINLGVFSTSEYLVKKVFAGPHTSFAIFTRKKCENSPLVAQFSLLSITSELVAEIVAQEPSIARLNQDLLNITKKSFASAQCWNRSFLKVEENSPKMVLDFDAAYAAINRLSDVSSAPFSNTIAQGIEHLITSKHLPKTDEEMFFYSVASIYYGLESERTRRNYVKKLISIKENNYPLFKSWLQNIPDTAFNSILHHSKEVIRDGIASSLEKIVKYDDHEMCKDVFWSPFSILEEIRNSEHRGRENVDVVILLTQERQNKFIQCYKEYCEKIHISKFTERNFVERHNVIFKNVFFFPLRLRLTILHIKTDFEKVFATSMVSYITGVQTNGLYITVCRNNVLGTLSRLSSLNYPSNKLPLRVDFVEEPAQDIGAVVKEYFLLLFRSILNPDYSMFENIDGQRLMWFNSNTLEPDSSFKAVGTALGMLIYQKIIVNLPFPLALYKKLIDVKITKEDLKEFDPEVYNNFENISANLDLLDNIDHTFVRIKKAFDNPIEEEIIPNGKNIPVTRYNWDNYVDAYIEYVFNTSISSQFNSFRDGFEEMVGKIVPKWFSPEELQKLAAGDTEYDWNDFQASASYQNCSADDSTIQMFWVEFFNLSIENKRKFLYFLTGSDRAPITGLTTVRIIICLIPEHDKCMVAHVCTSQLDLPTYRTAEKMRQMLLFAIENREGFGII